MEEDSYPFCAPIKENDERVVYNDPTNPKRQLSNIKAATVVVILEMLTQRENHGMFVFYLYLYIDNIDYAYCRSLIHTGISHIASRIHHPYRIHTFAHP